MKKFCIIFVSLFIITLAGFSFSACGGVEKHGVFQMQTQDFLRIHIRADSNLHEAQAVKYLVKDALVKYLVPLVAKYSNKKEAVEGIEKSLPELQAEAEKVLKSQGFPYGASVRLSQEIFPTRVYGEYTLQAGEYTALIIELGQGKGENWWCVVYPPLCFSTATQGEVIYKSKIMEIIRAWKEKCE